MEGYFVFQIFWMEIFLEVKFLCETFSENIYFI